MALTSAPVVKTSVYEGPLDLLLELIEKRKLLINDISLATVTEEYITKIKAMKDLPVGETAEFVSLAATLLLIKSRSLLPLLTLSDDESHDIKELQYRLAVYQLIKNSTRALQHAFDGSMLYEGAVPTLPPMYVPDPSVTPPGLRDVAHVLIDGFPKALTLPKVGVSKIMSLEEMIERLAQRVGAALKLSFKEFSGKNQKPDIIVSFLALLELVKQGIINATQEKEFGDINLESSAVSTPTYE
ncbi:MAG: ScpA family protein [bacterium]|nr:ScpA family protein [bacterium]